MRILVTGGAGFIGSHVAERLIGEGHSVSIIDDLNEYYSPRAKLKNLQAVRAAGQFSFWKADITDELLVRSLFEECRPEVVIHLAARAGVRPSIDQPFLYERVNVHGTLALLEASRTVGVRKFVFASSSSIYGIANQVPFREDDCVNQPISPYAATKIAGEKLCYTYSHLYSLSTVCLRFFTAYGPRQRPDLAIRKFAERIQAGLPISLYGDGLSGRDYTFIDDLVDGICHSVSHDCRFDVFNLGNSQPVRLIELIRTLERVLGRKADLKQMPDQPGDVPITYADISKAKKALGYAPKVDLQQGLERFVAWQVEQSRAISTTSAELPLWMAESANLVLVRSSSTSD